jgi:outer membrane immunogenic protein
MKKFVLGAAIAAVAVSTSAWAGPEWTGFYVGANGGWGWSHTAVSAVPIGSRAVTDFGGPVTLPTSMTGAMFGGQAGVNWNLGGWILGVEGDFDGAGIDDAKGVVFTSGLASPNTDAFSERERVNWLASIRARFGIAMGDGLFYITGGGGWEDTTTNAIISANTGSGTFGDSGLAKFSKTGSGYSVGGGVEEQIADDWTVRAEYLFYGFNNKKTVVLPDLPNCPVAGECVFAVHTGSNNVSAVRVGVNYLFN